MIKRAGHPGRTQAERRVLDEIGCGNNLPMMGKATREALLRKGLIVQCGEKVFGTGWSAVRVPEYEMPIPVHIQWRNAMTEDA